mgnify:CR=1 FL=1
MSRREFLRVWDEWPDVKHAELINGVVFVASPVGADHSTWDTNVIWWLKSYAHATAGVQSGNNATWMMLDSAPQPDGHLCLAPGLGGSAKRTENFYQGAPELAVEVTETSTSMDFGPKLVLYARAGVQEYLTFETLLRRLTWRRLVKGDYQTLKPGADGVYRSRCFPGLWLDGAAFWADDGSRMKAAMDAGLASEAHAQFVQHVMASWRASGGEPDIARVLPSLLDDAGLRVRSTRPHIFCTSPADQLWRWPASFIGINLKRMVELGRVDQAWADMAQQKFDAASADPRSLILTPLVLEIIAEKAGGA